MFRLAGRCADHVVCVSEDSLRLSRHEGITPTSMCTIWNGIDRQRFPFVGATSGGPALYVGRLSPEKDVATLLRAVAIAVRQQPAFRLQIAGGGACADGLAALSKELGIAGNVEFLGEVRDVAALYARASLFVLPSLTEGLPLTVLEAMSSGLPAVATRVGGTPEAVEEGVTGLLVPTRDPARLAEALLRLNSDHDLAARMGVAGHRRVEQHFDVRTMVSKYETLYERTLQGSVARAA
jgi:glycosyltransferase involved in cell wall biosynthesis